MKRILEPEIMGNRQQAIAYAAADFSASNQLYVNGFAAYSSQLQYVIDLGCGPADIAIRLARTYPHLSITAIDGSDEMIRLAEEAIRAEDLQERIILLQAHIPCSNVRTHMYDAVLSKDFLHHLPDPMVLWKETRRLGRSGAAVYVMDLFRPETHEAARRIVESAAENEPTILKEDFYNSLCAAFTLGEVREQLRTANLGLSVSQVSDRHMVISGFL